MSYSQFGYSYPSSSQLLMTGQHPATSCCQPGQAGVTGDPHGAQPSPAAAAAVCSLPAAYDSRLLSTFPRLATGLTVNGLYGSSYGDQSYVAALGTNPSAFYSSLPNPYDLKDNRTTWGPLPQATAAACYPYDPTLAAYGPYGERYGAMDSVARRKNATRETTNTLKAWLYEHRKNPYPTKGEKIMLAIITKMTLTQVSTWFANARRRLKKENKMTWEPRNKSGDAAESEEKADNSSCSPTHNDKKDDDGIDLSNDEDSEDISHPKTETPDNDLVRPDLVDAALCAGGVVKPETDCLSLSLSNYASADSQPGDGTGSGPPPTGRLAPDDACSLGPTDLGVLGGRPKIWSLAHTATSDSPPMLRRSPVGSSSLLASPHHQTDAYGAAVMSCAALRADGTQQQHMDAAAFPDPTGVTNDLSPSQRSWLNGITLRNGDNAAKPTTFNGSSSHADVSSCVEGGASRLSVAQTGLSSFPQSKGSMMSPHFVSKMDCLVEGAEPLYSTSKLPSRLSVSAGFYGPAVTSPTPQLASSIEFSRPPPPLIRGLIGYPVDDGSLLSAASARDPTIGPSHTDRMDAGHLTDTKDFINPAKLSAAVSGGYGNTAFRPVAKNESTSV